MDIQQLSIEDLVIGYLIQDDKYQCIFCKYSCDKNEIFQVENRLINAEGKIQLHLSEEHSSPFHAILGLDPKITGLSETQIEMMKYFFDGLSDSEIVQKTNLTSVSTVRQHRFKFREKERQAKVFLSLMELLKKPNPYAIHEGAKQGDERYGVEEKERDKVLKDYFKNGLSGEISNIPSKEKKKLIVLAHILKRFEKQKKYSEAEVNTILKTVHSDYVSLRRHLIEYGFMDRENSGSSYWIKG